MPFKVIGYVLGCKFYIILGYTLVLLICSAQIASGLVWVASRSARTLLVKICPWF